MKYRCERRPLNRRTSQHANAMPFLLSSAQIRCLARLLTLAVSLAAAGLLPARPTVVSTVPPTMGTGVSPTAPVVFTFSEAMNPAATTASFMDVNNSPPQYRTALPAWSGGNTVLTCTPVSPWPANHMIFWMITGAGATGEALDAATGLFTVSAEGTGCDTNASMLALTVSKSSLFKQSAGSAPVSNSNAPYCFLACATLPCPCDATNMSLRSPGGSAANLALSPIPGHLTLLDCSHTNADGLENTYTNGDYQFSIQGGACAKSIVVNYSGLTAPPAPNLRNLVPAQSIHPNLPFRLRWDSPPSSPEASCIYVEIYGGVFQTPALGSPGALDGSATSVIFPAGTFQTNHEYSGIVAFYHYRLSTNPEPSLSLVYHASSTEFTLRTGAEFLEVTNIVLPTPLYLETFDGASEGALPAGWSARNFTDPETAGANLNNPRCDSYRDWLVISRDRVGAIEQAGTWVSPARLLVKPGQSVNGVTVTNLVSGKFAYAESEARRGNQVQYLFSPDYDFSNKRRVYLSYHSIYEQKEGSMGAVEYSIDGGTIWLPVVYMIDAQDIVPDPSGEIDGWATFSLPHLDTPQYFNSATGQLEGGSYGAFVGADPGSWSALGRDISARVDGDVVKSKRVEVFRLPQADHQPAVRLRFAQAGKGGWYFGIDDVGFYSIPSVPLPVITLMPQSQTLAPGATLTLTVAATGVGLAYEWRFNGVRIPGQTSATLVIPNVDLAQSGGYQAVVSNDAGAAASAVATVTILPGSVAADPSPMPGMPDNPGFESGFTGWNASGTAFASQPTCGDSVTVKRVSSLKQTIEARVGGDYWLNLTYPIGHRGNYWIGTAENHPDDRTVPGATARDEATGTLISQRFRISHNYISFLVGGDEDLATLRIELLVDATENAPGAIRLAGRWYAVAVAATGHGEESLRREVWNVAAHVGQCGLIRIQDSSTNGHLNGDDFRFQDSDPYSRPVKVGLVEVAPVIQRGGHYYDWDSPVWGMADLHTHPMSYLGFGGKLMHGQPDGSIADALGNCKCDHGGWGIDNTCGDYYRELIMKVMEEGNNPHGDGYSAEPWKQFRDWPVFSSLSHQQMWHEWIRRTYDGGLRVMVALCVNNRLLAHASKGDLPEDDRTVGDSQIQAMKDFASRHSDFVEIAYDPFQLRDIVRRNKLAIVLGSELDDIGNLGKDRTASEESMRAEIQRLYESGIRYIFPVHLTDNPSGGTAVGEVVLDIANKYVNGRAFDLEASATGDFISFKMDDLDFTEEAAWVGVAAVTVGPALPAIAGPILQAFATPQVVGGAGLGVGSALLPLALFGVGNEILLNAIGIGPVPGEVWPLFGHYPPPPPLDNGQGHRNALGLTPLGHFAVREMMRRGMMIDIDHMSQHMVTNVFALAKQVPGGYPLNSGHNSARVLGKQRTENGRTAADYQKMRELGGLVGVGIENGDANTFPFWNTAQNLSSSQVPNDCAGTSKTFAQNYLYAFEQMQGRGLALGTDADGFIPGPGPRFGPQSAYGIDEREHIERDDQVRAQPTNGVLYAPQHGPPLTTAAFVGPAVDPERDTDQPARREEGYEYNQDQRDFFAAIRIFYHDQTASQDALNQIAAALSDNYPNKRRINEYAFGLVKGVTGADPGWDLLSPDTGTREKLGIAVCQFKTTGTVRSDVWNEIQNEATKRFRFNQHCAVWDDYHKIFGNNAPMKRCQTMSKQWDINFEGMAHYGLIPDFLQDLSNAGLNAHDLSPLFHSAEDFAQMWTRCLEGAAAFAQATLFARLSPTHGSTLILRWFADGQEVVESTHNLGDPGSWMLYTGNIGEAGGYKEMTIVVDRNGPPRFYRVRKN